MAEYTLASVLQSLVHPTTIRIASGNLTAAEGKLFRPYQVLTLYGRGLRIYVPPSANAPLRVRCKNADSSERTKRRSASDDGDEYMNADNLFTKNIFVSEITNLKDNHFAGKVYRDIAEILSDLPFSVKANKSFFVCGDDSNPNEIRKICEGDVIHIDSHIDRTHMHILRGHVNGERVSIQLSNTSVDVTALPDSNAEVTVRSAATVMHMDYKQPKEMTFVDEDVQATYEIEVGFNVIPLREKPMVSVCCSERYCRDTIEDLDNDMLKIQNIWCFDFSEQFVNTVTVQIIDTDMKSSFKSVFGKEVDRDDNGFSLYNLYGKVCSSEYIEPPPRQIPPSNTQANRNVQKPPPLPRRGHGPPVPNRSSRKGSETLRKLPQAPPPPIHKGDATDNLPSDPPDMQSSHSFAKLKRQMSSPTFADTTFPEQDTFTQDVQKEHKLKQQQSTIDTISETTVVPTDDPNATSSSAISVSDTSGPNSTDEAKISEMPPPASDVVKQDSLCETTSSNVPDNTESDELNIKDMTIADLANLFRRNKLDHMANVCEEQVIDGVLLLSLDEEDLKADPINLKGLDLKKVKLLMQGHRPK